jgi:DNA-binding transcriptional ArsR family regulator
MARVFGAHDTVTAPLVQRPRIRDLTCKGWLAYLSGKQQVACTDMPERRDPDLLFKALADPSRRKLLDLLHAHDGRTLSELCEHMDMSRQGVTQHLDVLEEANLVATVRRGREKLHFLNPVPLQEIYERWIAKFEKPRLKALADLRRRLEKASE